MAFKIINDTVIQNTTNITVDGLDILVGDGDPTTSVLLQNVEFGPTVSGITQEMDLALLNTLSDANTYADAADAVTLQSAQTYADSVVASGTGTLTTDDIAEGANLYYTDDRVSTYLTVNGWATQAYTDSQIALEDLQTITTKGATTTDKITTGGIYSAGNNDFVSTAGNTFSVVDTDNAIGANFIATGEIRLNGATIALGSSGVNGFQVNPSAHRIAASGTQGDGYIAMQQGGTTYSNSTKHRFWGGLVEIRDGDLDMSANAIVDVADPTNAQDAATKAYVDSAQASSETNAETNANAYTDAREIAITTAYQNYTDTSVAGIVDSAPAVLDTLNELAAALGDDPSFATTVSNDIGTKVSKAGDTMTGALTLSGAPTSANHAATKDYVDSAVSTGTGALDTDSVPEGSSNQYYTDARVQNVIDTNTAGFVTTDTTYTAGEGLVLSGTEFAMTGNFDGDFTATGDVTAYSDRALKRNIQTIENGLDKVMNMRGVTFLKDEKDGLGVIAQEVEEVIPEVVKQDQHGMRSVAYGNIVGVLIEAIKEQQAQIEELKSKLNEK